MMTEQSANVSERDRTPGIRVCHTAKSCVMNCGTTPHSNEGTIMMRNARARGSHGGEGPGGRRCSCCRSAVGARSYRTAEKRAVRQQVEEER